MIPPIAQAYADSAGTVALLEAELEAHLQQTDLCYLKRHTH